jgi:hypothetical protein
VSRKRLALGGALLAYVPLLAWVSLVATPAYGTFPMLSAFVAPIALVALALGVLLGGRAARTTAWLALAILALWLVENVTSIFLRLVDWERRMGAELGDALAGAVEQSLARSPYWLAVLLPLCVAAAYLWRTR